MLRWLEARVGLGWNEADPEQPFAEQGLDSLAAVELSQAIEDQTGVRLNAVTAWNYPTPSALAAHIAERMSGRADEPTAPVGEPGGSSDADFDSILAEVEGLSDDEVGRALSDEGHFPQSPR
jgi:acyl carrier protein